MCTVCQIENYYDILTKTCKTCVQNCRLCVNNTSCSDCIVNTVFNSTLGYCNSITPTVTCGTN